MIDLYFVLDLAEINGVKEAFLIYQSSQEDSFYFYWDSRLRMVLCVEAHEVGEDSEGLTFLFSYTRTTQFGKESETKFAADILAALTYQEF